METVPADARLLEIAKQYWRTDDEYYRRQENSPESLRLYALWEQELKKIEGWRAFLRNFTKGLPPGFRFGDGTTGTVTVPSFRSIIYFPDDPATPLTRWLVVGCVSILAPVYVIFGAHRAKMKGRDWREYRDPELFFTALPEPISSVAERLGQAFEKEFGVRRLPWEVALQPVPLFVEDLKPPQTLLFHALFTSDPASIP